MVIKACEHAFAHDVYRTVFVFVCVCHLFSRSAVLTLLYQWRLTAQYTRYAETDGTISV